MTVSGSKLSKGFQVLNLGGWSPATVRLGGNGASLVSLLEPEVDGVATDAERSTDVAFLFSSLDCFEDFQA